MSIITYLFIVLACGVAAYKITGFIFAKYIGEFLNYTAKNGRRYRVLRQPNETREEAIARIRDKVVSDNANNEKGR